MKKIEKSVLVQHNPAKMLALVLDVPAYSDFLPWCSDSKILQQTPKYTLASLHIKFQGITLNFSTRNTVTEQNDVLMNLHQGPFKHLVGLWQFSPISADSCKVSLSVEYQFSNFLIESLLGKIFDKVVTSLVQAFSDRAEQIYTIPATPLSVATTSVQR